MNYNFFIIGGDNRNIELAKMLREDNNKVKVYGFENLDKQIFLNEGIEIAKTLNEIKKDNIIISAIPFTKDETNINMPYSNEKVNINLLKNTRFIAGKIPEGFKGIDVMKDEQVTIENTVATAEGAIAKAIEMSNVNITNSNTLILGFGRVGKMLAHKLKGLDANVYCEARKEEDYAWIQSLGYNVVKQNNLKDNLCKMNFIFNTIPSMILDKNMLLLVKHPVIIDLASKPYGVDFKTCERMKINAVQYGGIPGKISPKSSAEIIKNFIYKLT